MNAQKFLTDKALEVKRKFLRLSPKRKREFLDVSAPRIIEDGKKAGCSKDIVDYCFALLNWLGELHKKSEVKK